MCRPGAALEAVAASRSARRPTSGLDHALFTRADRRQPAGQCGDGGGTSSVGLRSKKPVGLSVNPQRATGMTGQSSGRGTWVGPNVCQTTMSSPSMSRSPAMKAGSPAPPGFWFTKSPAGQRWSGSYRVTQRWLVAKRARAVSGAAGSASSTGADSG